MKTRHGFVSNSSSSSFIIRKSALMDWQVRVLQGLFMLHTDCFSTRVSESGDFFEGEVEAHNANYLCDSSPVFSKPLSNILSDLCYDWGLAYKKDYAINYEDSAKLED